MEKFTGTCGYCKRSGFALKGDKLSQHGYNISYHYREGACPGSRETCLEASPVTLELLQQDLVAWIPPLKRHLKDLRVATKISVIESRYDVTTGTSQPFQVVYQEGDRKFDSVIAKHIQRDESRLSHLEEDLAQVKRALSSWKPAQRGKKASGPLPVDIVFIGDGKSRIEAKNEVLGYIQSIKIPSTGSRTGYFDGFEVAWTSPGFEEMKSRRWDDLVRRVKKAVRTQLS